MALTDISVRNAKPKEKPYKLSDGQGLYLLVTPNGGKCWRLKYYFERREKVLALGVYPYVSLAEAREKRFDAKKKLTINLDPSQVKREEKQQAIIKSVNTFEAIALEWFENKKHVWTEGHRNRLLGRLKINVFPNLSNRPIAEITAPELLEIIRTIENRGAIDMAHRVLQTCGQIFRYAIATGKAERDISSDLRGALKTKKVIHHSFINAKELPEFLQKLDAYDGHPQTKLALHLLILTFVRTTELRAARWEEFCLESSEWRIPAERMKMKQLHIVPLSKQAITILKDLEKLNGGHQYLFPNQNNYQKFMSENTMLYAIYRMGYHSKATTHGFRSTASTILNEMGFRPDVIERQLAHAERNEIRASYNHAEYLPERRKMMQHWADYLEEVASGGSNLIIGKFGVAA